MRQSKDMAHIHGAGKPIKKRMRRIMKEGHEVSLRLPTEQGRKEAVEKLLKALKEVRNASAEAVPAFKEMANVASRTKIGAAPDKRANKTVQEG
jgi:hypothetical protein